MLKIVKLQMGEGGMEFALIGRLQAEHVNEVRELIRQERSAIVFDLRELQLVDRSAVQFLASCERDGVVLRNCAPHIRDWVTREAGKQSVGNGDEG
ncbi:MAG: hypothetical protein WBL50_21045 [Candidatus Acidiferrum sp.]